jgi:hypothetical protein
VGAAPSRSYAPSRISVFGPGAAFEIALSGRLCLVPSGEGVLFLKESGAVHHSRPVGALRSRGIDPTVGVLGNQAPGYRPAPARNTMPYCPAPACKRWITSGVMSSDRSAATSAPDGAAASKIMA